MRWGMIQNTENGHVIWLNDSTEDQLGVGVAGEGGAGGVEKVVIDIIDGGAGGAEKGDIDLKKEAS